MEMDVRELDRLRRAGDPITVLDVREPWEVDLCREGVLVVVCHHGVRSGRAAAWLRAQGFENAHNLSGGIDSWAREVEPSMRTY